MARDTIVALSSGALPAGVAVIRISGPATRALLGDCCGSLPPARLLALRDVRFGGEVIDRGLVAFMPAPNSFTGEDCGELHVHGSPAVVRAVLAGLTAWHGVRLAEPGEFTRRAFLNGKLDLTAVEGIGDLLLAETESQRRQAVARAGGGLAERIGAWRQALLDLRAEIEARLDFADESDVDDTGMAGLHARAEGLAGEIGDALAGLDRGRIVRDGLRVALAGPPNAGKSSLLNALARSDLAIVSSEAGTTRDLREVALDLDGNLVVLIDMAGLRETTSLAEAEGVRRATHAIAGADLVLWLSAPDIENLPPPAGVVVWPIATKSDMGPAPGTYRLSATTGAGVATLLAEIGRFGATVTGSGGAPALVSRERDRAALVAAGAALAAFLGHAEADEIAAEHLRVATQALERLLGRIDSEDVLGRIFSSFCIGK